MGECADPGEHLRGQDGGDEATAAWDECCPCLAHSACRVTPRPTTRSRRSARRAGRQIGLGGAEFRLSLLLGLFALAAHQAVRLNLLVGLATVAAAAAARFGLAPAPDLAGHLPEIAVLALGSTAAAYSAPGCSPGWTRRRSPD